MPLRISERIEFIWRDLVHLFAWNLSILSNRNFIEIMINGTVTTVRSVRSGFIIIMIMSITIT